MAKPKGLTIDQDIVAQEFDLEDITGYDLSEDPGLMKDIAEDIADYIRNRAASGKGIGGKEFTNKYYSEAYEKSFEFKQYGKKPGEIANMRLKGDMLQSIDTLDTDGNIIVVGIEGEEAAKAHGHMTGKNGTVPNMKREFFGLTQAELKSEILSKYSSDIEKLGEAKMRVEDFLLENVGTVTLPRFTVIAELTEIDEDDDAL